MTTTIMIVGSIVFYNWKIEVNNVMVKDQNGMNTAIVDTIEDFINSPIYINEMNHHVIENEIVDIYAEKKREAYFVGVMQAVEEHVYSFGYGTEQGEYYGARRNLNNQIEIMKSDEKTDGKSEYYSIKSDLTAGKLSERLGKFDPRTRDWYIVAKEKQRPVFSSVYKHFVMNDLAISAPYPIYDQQGVLKGVLATHIILSKVNGYLKEVVKDKNASAYIVERVSGNLVANSAEIPNFITSSDGKMNRVSIEKINNNDIVKAYENYKETTQESSIVNTEDNKIHVKISEFKKDGLDWLIITAIAESYYTMEINKSISSAVVLSILAIIIAILIFTKSVDQFLKPIYSLIRTTERFSRGDRLQREEIFRNDEIGKLADAFNKMAEELCLLINNLEEKVIERTRQLSQAKDKLELLSQIDFLTNLYNRRFLIEKIEQEVKRCNRTKEKFTIIMGDIDHFKIFNDTYGHDCGDLILKEVANILQKAVRETDCVSRWGGEEFLLLLTKTEYEGALILAERIRQAIEQKEIPYLDGSLKVTATLGIAVYKEGMTIDEVIKNADIAVYRGKDNGRNRVEQFDA